MTTGPWEHDEHGEVVRAPEWSEHDGALVRPAANEAGAAFDGAPDSDFEVVAECAPPDYDEQSDPHNGAFDGVGQE